LLTFKIFDEVSQPLDLAIPLR